MKYVDVIFDRYGTPRLRVRDDGRLYNFAGGALGFMRDDAVYNFKGFQVGWLGGGILRDLQGNTVGFGENPTDSPRPLLPIRQIKPIPSLPEIGPIPPIPEVRHIRPIKSFSWSLLDPYTLFYSRGYNG